MSGVGGGYGERGNGGGAWEEGRGGDVLFSPTNLSETRHCKGKFRKIMLDLYFALISIFLANMHVKYALSMTTNRGCSNVGALIAKNDMKKKCVSQANAPLPPLQSKAAIIGSYF